MSEASILFPNLGITLKSVGQQINVFGFEVAYYGIVIALAMLCGVSLILRLAKKTGQNDDMYFDVSLITIVLSLIGARLYYVIFSWENYRDNPLEIFNFRGGGLAIYGGVLTGILSVWIFSRLKKQSFGLMADTIIPGLVLGQVIGRWGNFFNREVFGGYTDSLLAMALPRDAVRQSDVTREMLDHLLTVDGVEFIQVHPTFLYESLWNLALLLFLLWLIKRKHFHGEIFLCYLAGYGLGRAWIEGIRTDQLLIPGMDLPVSQALSVALAAGALLILLIKVKREGRKREDEQSGQLKEKD